MHDYYGDREKFGIGSGDPLDMEGFEKLLSVKFPTDVEELADLLPDLVENSPAQEQYESLDPMTTLRNKKTFLSLFPNRFASSIKRGKEGDWRQTSQFHHLSDEEILETIGAKLTFKRACMADKNTRFLSVLIDKDSFYRTPEGLGKIRDCFRCVGVNQMKLYMMEDSEEWQLIAFFDKPIDSENISALASAWLRRNGIVPGTAGVAVYPHSEPLCIPLQSGFCWINDNGHIIVARNEVSPEAALGLFISDIERTASDGDELVARLEQVLSTPEKK